MAKIGIARSMPLALLVSCGGSSPPATDPVPAREEPKGYGYLFEPDSAAQASAASVPSSLPLGPGGRLYPEAISSIVRIHFGALLTCYSAGLKTDPKLTGTVTVKCVFGEDGVPREVTDEGSTLPDKEVVACVIDKFHKLRFPPSRGGDVKVVYPIELAPADFGGNRPSK